MEKLGKIGGGTYMTHTIPGFVVNVYDLVNFDIDLGNGVPPDVGVPITKKYVYADYCDDDLCLGKSLIPKIGYATRCHLRGVSLDKSTTKKFLKANAFVKFEIERLLNHSTMVSCTVTGIDMYSRLLVDIYITTNDDVINLREFLLHMQTQLDVKLFRSFGLTSNIRGVPRANEITHKSSN